MTDNAASAGTPLLWSDDDHIRRVAFDMATRYLFGKSDHARTSLTEMVYKTIRNMRDEMQAELDALRAANAEIARLLAESRQHEEALESLVHATEVALKVKADDLLRINFDLERMTQLEAALQEGRAWSPVDVRFTTRGEGFGDTEFRVSSKAGSGKPNVIHVYRTTLAGWAHVGLVMLPDDIRLCRLVTTKGDDNGN